MNDLTLICFCGNDSIKHAFEGNWKCDSCGRFHGYNSMDRMADAARAKRALEQ